MQITTNTEAWQKRALLGVEQFRASSQVDPEKIAVVGYGFGGATAMQLTYAGASLTAAVSVYGPLSPPTPEQAAAIKPRILVAHGASDESVPKDRIEQFSSDLNDARVDWEMDIYGGAKHGFANPYTGGYGMDGLAYNERADRRSWARLLAFLKDSFARDGSVRPESGGQFRAAGATEARSPARSVFWIRMWCRGEDLNLHGVSPTST